MSSTYLNICILCCKSYTVYYNHVCYYNFFSSNIMIKHKCNLCGAEIYDTYNINIVCGKNNIYFKGSKYYLFNLNLNVCESCYHNLINTVENKIEEYKNDNH